MSQLNNKMEEKIGIAQKLIEQLENHRDQASGFREVAEVLKTVNEHVEQLQKNFAALEPGTLSEQLTELQQQNQNLQKQLDKTQQTATEIVSQIARNKSHNKKWFIALTAVILIISGIGGWMILNLEL